MFYNPQINLIHDIRFMFQQCCVISSKIQVKNANCHVVNVIYQQQWSWEAGGVRYWLVLIICKLWCSNNVRSHSKITSQTTQLRIFFLRLSCLFTNCISNPCGLNIPYVNTNKDLRGMSDQIQQEIHMVKSAKHSSSHEI